MSFHLAGLKLEGLSRLVLSVEKWPLSSALQAFLSWAYARQPPGLCAIHLQSLISGYGLLRVVLC